MPHADFIHLRVHSAYSLSEGAIRVKELIKLCEAQGMPAVAVTDTNNLFGAMEFSEAAAAAGVQPIIGCQVSVTRDEPVSRGLQRPLPDAVVVLAQNDEGYGNILKLLRIAFLDAEDASDPQVSLADLEAHNGGLLLLTGGPAGPVGRLLAEGRTDVAEAMLRRHADSFPGRLYVEVMRHGLEVEQRIEEPLLDLAYKLDLPLVATNEAFFSTPDMYEAHDALICIAEGAYLSQGDRRRLTPEHFFKSAQEMRALFEDLPEAVDNTLVVARRCAFMVRKRDPLLPTTRKAAGGMSEPDVLRALAREGLEKRLQVQILKPGMNDEDRLHAAKPYRERLEYELDVIIQMGFSGYFLIVCDFIQWAKNRDIPVGPGRGSGAGSVVAWALTITDLDPLRFGLLFERFLNPERVSMPDFDIDFCQDRRDEVIHYVQEEYGRDRVAQIITFGKLQARAVLRDVGRVLQMPYGQVDKICKLVPNNPAKPVSVEQAVEGEPQLRRMIEDDETVAKLVDIGKRLEGLYRHASTHAAGVVIGDRPLDALIPLYRDPRSDMPVTGFNMKFVESAGLVKFDFLGLKTLTVLATAIKFLRQRGVEVDLSNLPLNDPETFKMLSRGDTTGVFQFESAGMRDVLRKLKPDTLEDLIAVVALYRPGPMDNIPAYIRRKHGEEPPDYLHSTLEGILKETFGIMIYQEQVMQIAQELSGYTLGGADLLRRAMGKKIQAEMDQQRKSFVDGAVARGVPETTASEIFDQVAKFAGYGFNKSHAAAYALVAYQTAYLKANHAVEFMAASMSLDINNTDKLNVFRQELIRLGIPLLPPDINTSRVAFSVEGKSIRYALAAVKNVGGGAMEGLIEERGRGGPFKDLADFSQRLDPHVVNKRQLENLVRAGAMDSLNPNRCQTFEVIESLLRHASTAASERQSNQMGLFGGSAAPGNRFDLPKVTDWSLMERLNQEFDAIGFYLSGHPLDAYGKSLRRLRVKKAAEIIAEAQSGLVAMAGTVIDRKEKTSAKGNRFAFVRLSDSSGVFEVTVFSEQLAMARELLEPGQSVFLKANAQFEGETARFTVIALDSLEKLAASAQVGLKVVVDGPEPLEPLRRVLERAGRGKGRVTIVTRLDAITEVELDLKDRYAVSPHVFRDVSNLPGILAVEEL